MIMAMVAVVVTVMVMVGCLRWSVFSYSSYLSLIMHTGLSPTPETHRP